MADNITHKPGERISVACSYPAEPDSGDPVRYGGETGIAITDEDADGNTVIDVGPFEADFSVEDSETGGISVGDLIWFHDATQMLNNTATGGTFFGTAREAVSDGETATIKVRHPGQVGALTPVEDGGVTATKLNTLANTRTTIIPLGAVSATTTQVVFVAPTAGSLAAAKLVTKNAIVANDTNYWTATLYDKGAAGAGTDKIVEKTTQATGGAGLAAYTAYDLGTLDATHKVLAAGDVVALTLTKTESATAFAEAALMLTFLPAEA